MSSLGQGLPLKTRVLSYATLLFGFYMAWNIGANDVSNAIGPLAGALAILQGAAKGAEIVIPIDVLAWG
jgi:sodium-dependent phosphate transporter